MPSRKPCKRPRQKALAGRTKSSPEKQAATDRETNVQIASRLQVPRQNGRRCSWLQESTCGQKIQGREIRKPPRPAKRPPQCSNHDKGCSEPPRQGSFRRQNCGDE